MAAIPRVDAPNSSGSNARMSAEGAHGEVIGGEQLGIQPSSFPTFSVLAGVSIFATPDHPILSRIGANHDARYDYEERPTEPGTVALARVFTEVGRTQGLAATRNNLASLAERLADGHALWNITFHCNTHPNYISFDGLANTRAAQAERPTGSVNLRGVFDYDLPQALSEGLPVVMDARGIATLHPYQGLIQRAVDGAEGSRLIVIVDQAALASEISRLRSVETALTPVDALQLLERA